MDEVLALLSAPSSEVASFSVGRFPSVNALSTTCHVNKLQRKQHWWKVQTKKIEREAAGVSCVLTI